MQLDELTFSVYNKQSKRFQHHKLSEDEVKRAILSYLICNGWVDFEADNGSAEISEIKVS